MFSDSIQEEKFITPSIQGLQEISLALQNAKKDMEALMYSLTNAINAYSSSDNIETRIRISLSDVISLNKNICNGMTLQLEMIDFIMNDGKNRDSIQVEDNFDISEIIKDTISEKNNEKVINNI